VADWDWSRVVFDHVKIGVRDAEASKAFYRTVLAALEIPPLWESDHGGQYANLVLSDSAPQAAPLHIGFVALTPEHVDAFHRTGLEAGYRDNGAPGVRERYSSPEAGLYYAAFLFDPDGNNIEAVHRGDFEPPAAA
jgi:catechol 2,3-dioxygenase-like lactoylglutathione lyase family enzyme